MGYNAPPSRPFLLARSRKRRGLLRIEIIVEAPKYVSRVQIHASIVNQGTISDMDDVIRDILDALREHDALDAAQLDKIVRKHSKQAHDGRRLFAKKRILPYYLSAKAEGGERWRRWRVNESLDARMMKTLQMKPRRTASGVATITVITKPWPCANRCVYCPNDPRMPKSYLSDEPACQRAERNLFHPYLQVASRLNTLSQMGHATDKIELIVLGGTWLDYPKTYHSWFVHELFRALNDDDAERRDALARAYETGVAPSEETNENIELALQHERNESAAHRVVGLVVETRPDTVTCEALTELRTLGCTKIQLGVQSVDPAILKCNGRHETPEIIREALALSRLFGFKTHTHFMLNLLGATPESDKRDYLEFMSNPAYRPDEVKLYPCALVANTKLVDRYESGTWRPYTEDELIDVLCTDMEATPAYCRVSRMIRDISAKDILVGNKKTNLRQLVDQNLQDSRKQIREIRFREISTDQVQADSLRLDRVDYTTTATDEVFLQWVTPDYKIAGFLRLSLPHQAAIQRYGKALPIKEGEAMIREVHVYGVATRLSESGSSAQHHGLGRALVEEACRIARDSGYERINVISAVGTRYYYRMLGFYDNGLYLQRACR